MIKGVNKQVLEINETESGYFEKAVFFVKPEYSGMSEARLRESARRELSAAGEPPRQKNLFKESKLRRIMVALGFGLAGCVFGILISLAF